MHALPPLPQLLAQQLLLLALLLAHLTVILVQLEHVPHARLLSTSVVLLAQHVLSQMEIVIFATQIILLNASPALLASPSQPIPSLASQILPTAKSQI